MQYSEANLYDEVLVGNLASVGMEQQLTGGQHCASACGILTPM